MPSLNSFFDPADREGAPPPSTRFGALVWFGVVLIIAVAVVVVWLQLAQRRQPAALSISGPIAILPVVNATGRRESSWVQYGLMEMIAETVSRTAGTRIVAPRYLNRMIEPRIADGDDPAVLARRREFVFALGASYAVEVSLTREDGASALAAVIYQPSGELARERFERRDLDSASGALAAWLAASSSRGVKPVALEQVFTDDPFLNRLYATGVDELRSKNADGALPYFEIALHHRPNFLEARAQLAECHRKLGDFETSRVLATSLLEDSRGRAERRLEATALALLGRIAAIEGENTNAYDLFLQSFRLWKTLDDSTEQAMVVAEGVRVALGEGDSKQATELLQLGLGIQRDAGDLLGEMESLLQLGSLGLTEENSQGAEQAFAQIAEIADELDDTWTQMRIVSHLGEIERRAGNLGKATELWNKGLAYHRRRAGERSQELVLAFSLGQAYRDLGRFEASEDAFRDVLELAVEMKQQSYEARASVHLAELLLRQGFHFQARPHLDRGIELMRWIDRQGLLRRLIAWMAYEQGNFRLAVKTQSQRRSSDDWETEDEELLTVFERAASAGRRLPLPHESGS